MTRLKYHYSAKLFLLIFINVYIISAQQGYPVLTLDNPSPGYLLIGPQNDNFVSLHDNAGKPIYTKNISGYGIEPDALRILNNGYFAFHASGKWIIMDQNLKKIDQLSPKGPYHANFHSLRSGPNGNYVLIADQIIIVDMSEKVLNGNSGARVWNHIIQEFDANKNLIFEWSCYDHIDVTDATEDIDISITDIDPYHINSVDYDSDGNLLANFRNLDEIIKIDRSTGEIIWIMGGSKSKKNQFTFYDDTYKGFYGFSHQHDPKRLPNGNILLFDNGNLKPEKFSRAVEYAVNEKSKTVTKVWEYRYPTTAIFSEFQGNAQRLPNGNTMIGWGCNLTQNLGTEVTAAGKIVMDLGIGNNRMSYQVLRNVILMNTVSNNIKSTQIYNFNDANNNTGVSLDVKTLSGSGTASIEKHNYPARNVSFNGTQPCSYLPIRWVLNYQGITEIQAQLNLNLKYIDNSTNKSELKIFWRDNENSGPFRMLETNFNQDLNRLETEIVNHGEFIAGYISNNPPLLLCPGNNEVNLPLNTILSWKPQGFNKNYIIQVALDENFESLVQVKNLSKVNYLVCDFLKNNTNYFWRVKANDNDCDKKWSETFTFSTDIGIVKLNKPYNNSTNQQLDGTLIWDQVSGANSYKIQLSENTNFKTDSIHELITDSCYFNYKNLKPMTRYYWHVSAGKNGLFNNWSFVYSFKTSSGKVILNSPINQSQNNNTEGLLVWSAINSVNNYCVQISDNSFFRENIVDTVISNKTEFNYTNLLNSSTYYWRVKGIFPDAFGAGDTVTAWSEAWLFETKLGLPTLQLPALGSLNIPVKGKLEWLGTYKKGITSSSENYQVQISRDPDFNIIDNDHTVNSSWFDYNNLLFHTQYYWRVRSTNENNTGEWSDTYSFTTCSELLSPKNDEYKIPTNTKLVWNESDSAVYYEVKLSKDKLFTEDNRLFSFIKSNELTIENLQNNTDYYWNIRSSKSGRYTSWSETFKFTTKLKRAKLLSPVEININSLSKIEFAWESSEGHEFYSIQVAIDSNFEEIVYNFESIMPINMGANEEYSINEKLTEGKYYWRVMAYNENNTSDWSETGSFNVITTLDVDEISINKSIVQLYPNPGNANITFEFNSIDAADQQLIKLTIVDILGNSVKTINIDELQLGRTGILWDMKDNSGNKCKSGYYRLIVEGLTLKESYQFLILE